MPKMPSVLGGYVTLKDFFKIKTMTSLVIDETKSRAAILLYQHSFRFPAVAPVLSTSESKPAEANTERKVVQS